MSEVNKDRKNQNIIVYGLVIIGTFVYISLVFNNNVWLDEAFTASLVRTDFHGVLQRSMADTLPPLYNILLKVITDIFGYNITVMKLVSVTPMILTMLLSATIVRKRHGFLTSVIFTIALFTMPNLLFFGVEIRMYSLGFFFATASGIFAYECITNSCLRNWAIFTVFSVLAGYSHHFAFVTVGLIYGYVLFHYLIKDIKNIKRFFICLLATFILYFPCLLVTLKQFKSVSGYFSMPDVTLSVFIKYMRYPYTVGFTPLSIILTLSVFALFIITVYKFIKNPKEERLFYSTILFLIYYAVLIFGTILSKIMTANIFVDRYLFFSIGLIWLFFAIEVSELNFKNENISKIVSTFSIVLLILSGIAGYIKEFQIEYSTNADSIDKYLETNTKPGDVLYTLEDNEEMAFCLPFYEENLTNYEDLEEALAVAESNNSSVYLSVIDYYDYNFKELEKYNFKAEYIDEFAFDRYTFKLYKLVKD